MTIVRRVLRCALSGLLLAVVLGAAAPRDTLRAARVIDGDTIKLTDGRLVRYIGLDAPEARRRQGTAWVVDPEPLAQEATEANRRLVADRALRLELDAQTHDRYGRLLAYVYADEVFVNAELLRGGWATLLTIPPNVRHVEAFRQCVEEARTQRRGLWAPR